MLHRAVFVDIAGDAERRELLHFLRAGNRAAKDQNRQSPIVQLSNRADQIDARSVRKPQVEDEQIDLTEIGADACQEFRGTLDGDRFWAGILQRTAKSNA